MPNHTPKKSIRTKKIRARVWLMTTAQSAVGSGGNAGRKATRTSPGKEKFVVIKIKIDVSKSG